MHFSDERAKRNAFIVVALMLHILPFSVRPALIGGDEPHYALMAYSLAVDGDADLTNQYEAVAAGEKIAGRKFAGKSLERHVRTWNGRTVFSHPIGLPALAAPLVWLKQRLAPSVAPDLILGVMTLLVTWVALLAGVRLVYYGGMRRPGAAAVLALYFSTPLWYYSRTFFTEPYLWAFSVLSVWALAHQRWALAATLLGLSILIKEAAALTVAGILVTTLLISGWREALAAASGPVLAGLVFCGKNILVYGEPLVTFQRFQLGKPLEGMVGVFLDSSHGLILFAPLAFVALVLWPVSAIRINPRMARVHFCACAVAAAWLFMVASGVDWRGGSCYGPRLLVPMLPALVVPLADAWRQARHQRWLALVLGAAFASGFTVQWCAALDPFSAFWSIPILRLLSGNPWATGSGLLVGLAASLGLFRWVGQEPLKTSPG